MFQKDSVKQVIEIRSYRIKMKEIEKKDFLPTHEIGEVEDADEEVEEIQLDYSRVNVNIREEGYIRIQIQISFLTSGADEETESEEEESDEEESNEGDD